MFNIRYNYRSEDVNDVEGPIDDSYAKKDNSKLDHFLRY